VPSASSTCSRLEPDRHHRQHLLVDDIALLQRLAGLSVSAALQPASASPRGGQHDGAHAAPVSTADLPEFSLRTMSSPLWPSLRRPTKAVNQLGRRCNIRPARSEQRKRKSPCSSDFFGLSRSPIRKIVDALYEQIVAAARQPRFYAEWGVPDTPLGRFEMLSLHMFLFLHRARAGNEALSAIAQECVDAFFTDIDHSLRELGIGDMGVPKRMKKLARMFYGRAQSYTEALEANDRPPWRGAGPQCRARGSGLGGAATARRLCHGRRPRAGRPARRGHPAAGSPSPPRRRRTLP
jgi:hypothetical protein